MNSLVLLAINLFAKLVLSPFGYRFWPLKGPVSGEPDGWLSDLGLLLGLLGQEDSLDVGEHTTLGNGDARQELVQLLVVPDGELQVPGDDPGLLVVTGGIAGQLENLSIEVLHNSGQVDRGANIHMLGVQAFAKETLMYVWKNA